MCEQVLQQHPSYFEDFSKKFKFYICLNKPLLPVDNYALAVHNSDNNYCKVKRGAHYHLMLFEDTPVYEAGAMTVPCPYSCFKLLIHEANNVQFSGDIFRRLQTAVSYNDKYDLPDTGITTCRRKLPTSGKCKTAAMPYARRPLSPSSSPPSVVAHAPALLVTSQSGDNNVRRRHNAGTSSDEYHGTSNQLQEQIQQQQTDNPIKQMSTTETQTMPIPTLTQLSPTLSSSPLPSPPSPSPPPSSELTLAAAGTQTNLVSSAAILRFLTLYNGQYGSDLLRIMDCLQSGYGSVFAEHHGIILNFDLTCSNAQCMCHQCCN